MNLCIQMGHLTRDPELRHTNSGTAVLNCSIATNRSVPKGDQFVDETTFVEFTMWGKRAEAFAKFHHKGSRALIRGRLTLETWDDRTTGSKRSKLKMTAEEWEFVMDRGAKQATESETEDQPF